MASGLCQEVGRKEGGKMIVRRNDIYGKGVQEKVGKERKV
jgi:hypothetical protein